MEYIVKSISVWRISIVRKRVAHLLSGNKNPNLLGSVLKERLKIGDELSREPFSFGKEGVEGTYRVIKWEGSVTSRAPPRASLEQIPLGDVFEIQIKLRSRCCDVPQNVP